MVDLIRGTEAVAGIEHKLPKSIERYLAALSKLYAQDGNRALQEIIVNAQARVAEGWTYDNWNGGTHGHALYLVVPELSVPCCSEEERDEIQTQICLDLNAPP